jgi:aminopeptidase N
MSARYEVRKKLYKGINLEVYFDPRHPYNVDKMLMSMEKSIDYYSANFGPYKHKQARIIEFPRYASFAQAFPGTMPYSEGIGFIANLEDPEDIDMVTYIVAHEMGHQWWAHQVAGADMQGATLLSESLSQYSALMVMERMYGKEQMHKFLKYEMDEYLSSRGSEAEKECPLVEVENQGYLHYQKGSVVLYYLREMIGESGVNASLKELVDRFAYQDPPYPNSLELVSRLEAQTPDSLPYLIDDLFRKITLFDNRALEATTIATDGGYKTTLKVQAAKMYADSLGRETPAELVDWIDVGVFAEPEEGKKYGKALEVKRVKITHKEQVFTFFTNEKPYQAGIDPYYYMVDRVPDDNLKKVTEKKE